MDPLTVLILKLLTMREIRIVINNTMNKKTKLAEKSNKL